MRIFLTIVALIFTVFSLANAQSTDPLADTGALMIDTGTAIGATAGAVGSAVGVAASAATGGILVNWFTDQAVAKPIIFINYVIGFIGAIFITLAGLLIQFGLILNTAIMNSEVVLIGWRLVRDITNLGFVIGIIVIAFSTMLRIENYAMKKTLAKLIAAALLVNFSLTIAGIFIDTSHVFTTFFVSKAIGGGADGFSIDSLEKFASNLTFAFNPQKLLQVDATKLDTFSGLASSSAGIFSLIASTFFVTLFTIFTAEGMLAIAIMILYRYIVLSILLIVMPMALLLWVFPGLEKHWKSWWSKFIEQIIFLPVSTFFIYLSILMVNVKANSPTSPTSLAFQINETSGQAFTQFLNVMSAPFSNIGQMLVVLGLLIGGLFTAKKLGAVGADTAIATATNMRNWILNQTGRRVGGTVGGLMGKSATGAKIGQGAAQRLENLATKIRESFMGGRATQVFKGTAGEKISKSPSERRADFNKEYKSMSTEKRIQTARLKTTLEDQEKAAAMAMALAQRDEIDLLVPKEQLEGRTEEEKRRMISKAFEPFRKAAVKSGDRGILKFMPDLSKDFGVDINTVMSELVMPEDVDKISYKSFEDMNLVVKLKEDQISRLGAHGTDKQREAIVRTILGNIDKSSPLERSKLESFTKIMRTDLSGGWTSVPRMDELVRRTKPAFQTPIKVGTEGASMKPQYPLPPSFISQQQSKPTTTPPPVIRPPMPPPETNKI